MTLEKAIAELSRQLEVKHLLGKFHQADALKLGIEALKHVEGLRKWGIPHVNHMLPGETKE